MNSPPAMATLPWTYRPLTLDAGVRGAFNRTPDKMALREGTRTLTYRQLIDRIDRVGTGATADLGLRQGQHAALISTNRLEFIEIVCGLSSVGVAAVMISPRLAAAEIKFMCDDSRSRVIFVEVQLEEFVRAIKFETVERIIVVGRDYEDWLARARAVPSTVPVQEWEPFSVHYTSGTTGKPKGVVLAHRSRTLLFFAMGVEYGCYSPDDRAIAVAPLCHGAGFAFAMAPVYFGGFCEILRRFEPDHILSSIGTAAASNIFLVPTHFHAMFALEKPILDRYRRGTLKTIIANAAPLAQATKEKIVDFFGPGILNESYGSTETGIVCNLRPADQLRKIKCVGQPLPCTEVRILDDDGNEVGPDVTGELYSRSEVHFVGYFDRPEETKAAFRGDWFSAGDMAQRDEEGYLYIVDRKKDMVISGGLNIYPREIEEVLFTHPAVREAAVIGVPDDYWGETLKAFVVLHPGKAPTPEELIEHCRKDLAGYKIPKAVVFIDALPRNTAGKVLKTTLRAQEATGK
ncbi:MAG: AMP-binding protein [Alphaproteobacteria bacterium]